MNAYLAARNPTKGVVTIYAEYSSKPKIKKVATGIKVSAAHWDNDNKLIKANAKLLGASTVTEANQTIRTVLASLNEVVKTLYLANGNILPTVEQLNNYRNGKAETIAAASEETLVTALEKWAAHQAIANSWSASRVKTYKALVDTIISYQQNRKITLSLSSISNEEIVKWQQYIAKVYNYANSSLATRVASLKTFLLDKDPKQLNLKKIKSLYSQDLTAPIALSKSEVLAIRELDLAHNQRLERVRDLMVIQIYTGLRYSDIRLLRHYHTVTGQIVIKPLKTRKKQLKEVKVPILHFVQFYLLAND